MLQSPTYSLNNELTSHYTFLLILRLVFQILKQKAKTSPKRDSPDFSIEKSPPSTNKRKQESVIFTVRKASISSKKND